MIYRPLADRLWEKALIGDPRSCWRWTGSTARGGYAKLRVGRNLRYAHRVAYELVVGSIPSGMELDHLCRVHDCINPLHLEPVTHRENGIRGNGWSGTNSRKTHCLNNHLFDDLNTYWVRGHRQCRACNRLAVARYKVRGQEVVT